MEDKNNKKQVLVVVALIRDKKGKIFLQKRFNKVIPSAHGKWEFPGGRVNFGESPEKAVKRECYEETGFKIKTEKMIPYVVSRIWHRADGGEHHAVVLCYESKLVKITPRKLHKKVSDTKWCSEGEIKNLDTLISTTEFLKFTNYSKSETYLLY